MRGLLLRRGLDEDLAADVAQQAFLVLVQRIGDVTEGKERTFLCTTALFIGKRVRRSSARESLGHDADTSTAEARRVDDVVDARRRAAMVLEIDSDLREVLLLSEVDGLANREIAERLAVPVGTVASRLRRAREHCWRRLRRS